MTLALTDSERELLGTFANVTRKAGDEVEFSLPAYMAFPDLIEQLEASIARQESDQGDWLRAKLWREAKPSLLDKMRKALLRGVP